jgi:hypothetical protein
MSQVHTAGAGRGEGARRPLIALSATKDVQDAILSEVTRSAVVDVIDFRYWWRTDKGEFAPPGGKNLAPRQFERHRLPDSPRRTRYHCHFPLQISVAHSSFEY